MKSSIQSNQTVSDVRAIWKKMKKPINTRLIDFKRIWANASDDKLFAELVFCLFTPQSKAKSCWAAVESLVSKGLLIKGSQKKVYNELPCVRFNHNKSRYVIEARALFSSGNKIALRNILTGFKNELEAREWLVANVKGLGYKESSHFLRNIGYSKDLAILDRHILKNLKFMGVISDIPRSITKKEYFNIENKMRSFAKDINIPLNHLDLLLWYKEAGEIFK